MFLDQICNVIFFFYSVLPCDIDDGEDVVENQVEAEGHQRLQVQEHKQHTPADQSAIRYQLCTIDQSIGKS